MREGEGEEGRGRERERERGREGGREGKSVQSREPNRKDASIDHMILNKNYVNIILGIFLSVLSYNLFDSITFTKFITFYTK